MSENRTLARKPASDRRPPAQITKSVRPAIASATVSSAKLLQRRLGNEGTQAFFAQAASPASIQRTAVDTSAAIYPNKIQARLHVSSPSDREEIEAHATGTKIARMPEPGVGSSPVSASGGSLLRKAAAFVARLWKPAMPGPAIQRMANNAGKASSEVSTEIQGSLSSGSPLPSPVRSFMEPRFRADFSKVRIHTGDRAATLSKQLNAQAFTYGRDIFFGKDQFKPDTQDGRELIAHELTHTIQQGAAVQRSESHEIVTHQSPTLIHRLFGIDLDPRSYLAEKASAIPGFTMLTVIIGSNPITGAGVDRSPGNILRGAIEMIPIVGTYITEALNNHGVFDKVSVWAVQQFNALKDIGSSIRQNVAEFISNFDITSPLKMLEQGRRLITEPVTRIKNFALSLKDGIVTFVKDAILKPIAAFAKANVPNGYDLLCAVMGKDPISGEPVPQTAENLIGPFMKLISQEEVWENMKKTNAIGRAWTWFQGALGKVKGFVSEIPSLFMSAFKALTIADIVLIPRAFAKLVGVFGGFAVKFVTWAGTAVWNLLEIIFDVVSPGALGYIKKTGAALKGILKNPLPFIGNLVKAAKLGFTNFADNIVTHLKAGLIDWLTGSLSGVYIPKALSLAELGKFALSILGITWAQIRGKIVKVLGPSGEKIMQGLETTFDIVIALVTGGPAAAWELIKEKLTNLKDTVISGIIGFVTDSVVKKAIPKLIAMFIPGAGFISAIISIYDTVMVFVEKISKIIQVVTAFIDSIVAIAGGAIGAAAKRVESILGGLLSLAISFLAGFLGLGKVTDKIKEVIEKVRGMVDKGIDAVIAWLVAKAKALFGKLFGGKDKPDERSQEQKKSDLTKGIGEAQKLLEDKKLTSEQVKKKLPVIKSKYKITIFELVTDAKSETKETDHIHGEIHSIPVKDDGGKVEKETDTVEALIAPAKKGDELQVKRGTDWYRAKIDSFDNKTQFIWCAVVGGGRNGIHVKEFISSYLKGGNTTVRQTPSAEPYNREKHYGKTPTTADRMALKAAPDQVVDHNPPLVKRYYDGDPMYGGKPGKDLTQAERLASAKNQDLMKLQPIDESNKQGGEMSAFSKQKKKELGK